MPGHPALDRRLGVPFTLPFPHPPVAPGANFRDHRRFEAWAREVVRLPEAGGEPLAHLLPEAWWEEFSRQAQDQEVWFTALSQATGIYFFPSREWVPRVVRYLRLLGVRRLLEAGAGRGYLTAALGPVAEAAGMSFRAVDRWQGEFVSVLPGHARVEMGDVFEVAKAFQPDAVLYAWPPPGQSLAPLFQHPSLRFLVAAGEVGGGVTGARQDWELLPHRVSPALSRGCRGRTGSAPHGVAVFWAKRRGKARL